jgi:putative ABC transport system permease protein
MSYGEILRFALRGLSANKLRSGLTTLGILIGVGAVILLVAVGNGSSHQIQQNIERLGSNSLTVTKSTSGGRGPGGGLARLFGGAGGAGGGGGGNGNPGGGAAAGAAGDQQQQNTGPRTQAHDLTVEDARALIDPVNAPAVKSASPVANAPSSTAAYEGSSHAIQQVVGTYPTYFEATNKVIADGSYFTNDDVSGARKVVVIGSTVASDLFGSVEPVGKEINVGGVPFTIVGVLKEQGGSGFQDPDDIAIAPLPAVQQSLTGFAGGLNQIVVQAKTAAVVNEAQTEATNVLNERHDISTTNPADFSIINQASLQSAVSASSKTFTVLLGAVAAISLLVGGIGITNIMLVTVTERTREIGIRKAIGAPKGAILGQFIAEATVLSLVGGVLGALAGVIGSQFQVVGVKPIIVPSSILLALGVSIAIGLFFGSYPANRAANLRPIEALRHE